MHNPLSLDNKCIFVTGASSGIGRSVAIECAKMGARLFITGRDNERLQETLSMLEGSDHEAIVADLLHNSDIMGLVAKLPSLDGIVFSAGINDKSLVKFVNEEKIARMFGTNFTAPLLLIQALLKQKKMNKGASVVLISSISATYATITNALYSSTKGALNSLLRVLALELSSQGIRVNGISPGPIRTKLIKTYELADDFAAFEKAIPLGRIGEPEDVANCALFLLAGSSQWMTGSLITLDGGITLR